MIPEVVGNLPSSAFISDAAVGNKVYLVVGSTAEATYSNKLYVADLSPVSKVAGGGSQHGPKDDGSLGQWGEILRDNWGMAPPPTDPRQSRLWMKMTAVAAGANASYFLKNDGSLWAMGDNRKDSWVWGCNNFWIGCYYPFDGNASICRKGYDGRKRTHIRSG